MSILVNLLPDIRQAKLRERHRRQLMSGVAVLVWAVCGGVIVVMSLVWAGQKGIIANHNEKIAASTKTLKEEAGLIDALTAQQHLVSLTGLYDKRTYLSKFFTAYIESNPLEISLNSMTVDTQNTLVVTGAGKSYASVAKLARALEAANVTIGTAAAPTNAPYFSAVNISSVSNTTGIGVSFTLSTTLDSGVTRGTK